VPSNMRSFERLWLGFEGDGGGCAAGVGRHGGHPSSFVSRGADAPGLLLEGDAPSAPIFLNGAASPRESAATTEVLGSTEEAHRRWPEGRSEQGASKAKVNPPVGFRGALPRRVCFWRAMLRQRRFFLNGAASPRESAATEHRPPVRFRGALTRRGAGALFVPGSASALRSVGYESEASGALARALAGRFERVCGRRPVDFSTSRARGAPDSARGRARSPGPALPLHFEFPGLRTSLPDGFFFSV
jgi:hypothetical protein